MDIMQHFSLGQAAANRRRTVRFTPPDCFDADDRLWCHVVAYGTVCAWVAADSVPETQLEAAAVGLADVLLDTALWVRSSSPDVALSSLSDRLEWLRLNLCGRVARCGSVEAGVLVPCPVVGAMDGNLSDAVAGLRLDA